MTNRIKTLYPEQSFKKFFDSTHPPHPLPSREGGDKKVQSLKGDT